MEGNRAASALLVCLVLATCTAPYFDAPGPLRPLALSADGRHLHALNTADDRLEVFATGEEGLASLGGARLGFRPIALTLCRPGELWVVNHLSDSVNVVDVGGPARVAVRLTLDVGDEPRGRVAAGPQRRWIMVAAARRGDRFGRDRYVVDESPRQRTIALIDTAVEWLESCEAGQGQPWTALDATADCTLASRWRRSRG